MSKYCKRRICISNYVIRPQQAHPLCECSKYFSSATYTCLSSVKIWGCLTFCSFLKLFLNDFHMWPTKSKLRASSTTWRCFCNVLVPVRGWKTAKNVTKIADNGVFCLFSPPEVLVGAQYMTGGSPRCPGGSPPQVYTYTYMHTHTNIWGGRSWPSRGPPHYDRKPITFGIVSYEYNIFFQLVWRFFKN